MGSFKRTATEFVANDSGATAIEYGMIVALVVVVIVTAVQSLGNTVLVNLFNKIASSM